MTPEQQAAYVLAQSVCALIEAMGMISSNMAYYYKQKEAEVTGMPYFRPERFNELFAKYGISHNDIISFYQK